MPTNSLFILLIIFIINMEKYCVSLLTYSLILIAIIILNEYLKKDVKLMSVEILKYINNYIPEFFNITINIFVLIFYYLVDILLYLMLFFRRNKSESFNIFICYCLAQMFTQLFKIMLHDSRPCFEYYTLSVENGCTCSFGFPS